ncbi:MAG TPA: DNA repair protein RecO [Desulforhopalus sp.]|nr:DNA repair protein RecO [Desulforhopalus sp.]
METEALVLDCRDHGESDLILTLYGRSTGRLSAIAKGAKKSRRRFVNKLEPFTFLHIQYRQKANQSLAFLAEAELYSSFINIRSSLELFGAASVIQEFLLAAIREGEPDEKIFRLSLWAFHSLDRRIGSKTVVTLFLVRLFDYLGYRPDFQRCTLCRTPAGEGPGHAFSLQQGGIVCTGCIGQGGLHLSPGTLKILQSAQELPLEKLHRLLLSETQLSEALGILSAYGRELLQRDIISWQVMRRNGRGLAPGDSGSRRSIRS